MTNTTGPGIFSRHLLIAPKATADVAVPADVPLLELVPRLADMVGQRPAASAEGLRLRTEDGVVLDQAQSLQQLQVPDGAALRLDLVGADRPVPIYDDVVQVIAVTASEKIDSRPVLAAGAAAVAVICAGLAAAVAAWTVASPVAAAVMALLAVGLATVATLLPDPDASPGFVLRAGAVTLPLLAGLSVTPGADPMHRLMLAAVAVFAYCLLVGTGLVFAPVKGATATVLAALATLSGLGILTSGLAQIWSAPLPRIIAVAGAGAVLGMALTPWLAVKVVGLPMPTTRPEDAYRLSAHDVERSQSGTRAAVELMHGWTAGLGLGAGIAAGLIVDGAIGNSVLAAIVLLVLLLRTRTLAHRPVRTVLLLAVLAGVTGIVAGAVLNGLSDRDALTLSGFLLLGASVAAALMLGAAGGVRVSPVALRWVDRVEVALLAALVPVTVWVSGLVFVVRHW